MGIGINVHQEKFGAEANKAVSLQQIKPLDQTVVALAGELRNFILKGIEEINAVNVGEVMRIFNAHLYKKNEQVKLKNGNMVFETTVKGINTFGQLETEDVLPRTFNVGEVEWV